MAQDKYVQKTSKFLITPSGLSEPTKPSMNEQLSTG